MKVALVTGGSRGIGRAVCIKLASMGYHVLINYHKNRNEAQITLENVNNAGGSGEILRFDVSKHSEVETVLENWQQTNPEQYIEVLVNNAGINKDIFMIFMENSHWNDVLNHCRTKKIYRRSLKILIDQGYRGNNFWTI